MKELGQHILDLAEKAKGDRTVLEGHWQEVAERVYPNYSQTFPSNYSDTKGEKKTEKMIDSTATVALTRFASVMESVLTPRNSTWHFLRPTDPYLLKDRQVREWFDNTNLLLHSYRSAPYANFHSQNHQNFMSLGAFGTACMYIDKINTPGMGTGLRYKSIHVGEIYFFENHQGIIDKAVRFFKMTARQAAQKWGDKELPAMIKGRLGQKPDDEFEFIHYVCPRDDYDDKRLDSKGKLFASYYVSKVEAKVMSEGGYDTFPYAISRYLTSPNEVYGRSPAMMCLPSIKVLNEEKATVLKQGHRALDPVLLAHDDGVLDSFSMKSGHLNYGGVSAEGRPLVHALPVGNLAVGKDLMDDEKAVINDMFLVSVLQLLIDSPGMTATEVLERSKEKGWLLAPAAGRQESEYLASMIDRELDVLSNQRLLPPMPQALLDAGGEYEIHYDSPISRMRKAEEAVGTIRWIEQLSQAATLAQDPSILDVVAWDAVAQDLGMAMNVPIRHIVPAEEVDAKRKNRNEQQQTQQMIDAAPGMAQMLKAGQGAVA